MVKLGVNIDHIATLRNARGGLEPDPVNAAMICEESGCDGITVHTREDARHMRFQDALAIRRSIKTRLNLEMAPIASMVEFAVTLKPDEVCLVPEKRMEVTTEGGLCVSADFERIKNIVAALQLAGIVVSIFVDPDLKEIEKSSLCRAEYIELHTGSYANASGADIIKELKRLEKAADYGVSAGLKINAGHGLNYSNVAPVAGIPAMDTLNIGHSIIARAVFTGLGEAVSEMKRRIEKSGS